MASSLFNYLGGNQVRLPWSFGDVQDMFERLDQFRQSFRGDPRQQTQQLLNSGQMSQDQYNYYSKIATQIQNMLIKR